MADLKIGGLKVRGRAGCKEEERAYPQMFTFDLCLTYDHRAAIEADDVAHAPDYKQVAALVREQLSSQTWRLIERMAFDVGSALLQSHQRVLAVQVDVSKDILPDAAFVRVSVGVTRGQDGKPRLGP